MGIDYENIFYYGIVLTQGEVYDITGEEECYKFNFKGITICNYIDFKYDEVYILGKDLKDMTLEDIKEDEKYIEETLKELCSRFDITYSQPEIINSISVN